MALCRERGGRRIYIPKVASADRALARIIGAENAAKVSAAYGGEYMDVPIGRTGLVRELCLAGKSPSEVIREARCCRRAVYKMRAALRAEGLLT